MREKYKGKQQGILHILPIINDLRLFTASGVGMYASMGSSA